MSPTARHPFLRRVRRVFVALLALYALVLLAAFVFQRRLIYFPDRLEGSPTGRAGEEVVIFPSADGTRISGLFVAPKVDATPVVLLAHGNAGNLLSWRPALDPFLALGYGAFLLDPRGYGWSEGSPGEAGWQQDAEAAMGWLAARGIAAPRIVLVGVSIGAGLALPLAAAHAVRGLILESPFTSLAAAASDHYPFLPCRLLLRDRYDNLSVAPRVICPVLILHGTADRTVPVAHARRLAGAFPKPPTLVLAEGFDHNDLSAWPGYENALREFLATLR